jgi:uncharacterized membrane protein
MSCYLGLGDSWLCFWGLWLAALIAWLFVALFIAFVIFTVWVNIDDGALHRRVRNWWNR